MGEEIPKTNEEGVGGMYSLVEYYVTAGKVSHWLLRKEFYICF